MGGKLFNENASFINYNNQEQSFSLNLIPEENWDTSPLTPQSTSIALNLVSIGRRETGKKEERGNSFIN
jgi:hypothetical protein